MALMFGAAYAQTGSAQSRAAEAGATDADSLRAVVEEPRPFGYVVGDLLTQSVLLEAKGRAVEPLTLPTPGRISIWFERRGTRVDARADGHRWLSVEYQLINAPRSLTAIRLPAWDLKTKPNGLTLRIPEWSVSVGPLTRRASAAEDPSAASQASLAGGDSSLARSAIHLRPDRQAPLLPTAPVLRSLLSSFAALALTLAAWLGWVLWRNHRAALNQPFAKAFRELRHTDESSPQSWQALHRAFDGTAGRVVQLESLPALFSRAPYLMPLRARIEQFFTQSSERFFGAGPSREPISLRELSDHLRRLEKRYER